MAGETELPSSWLGAGKNALGNSLWILPLLVGERAIDGHYDQAGILAIAWLSALAVAVKLHVIHELSASSERRQQLLTWALILGGAIALILGIYRLASSPVTSATNLRPQLDAAIGERDQARRERDAERDQVSIIRAELEKARQQSARTKTGSIHSFEDSYTIDETDVRKVRDEIFKVKEYLPQAIRIQTADDGLARGVANGLSKGIGFAGINSGGMAVGIPVNPQETGISIRIKDLHRVPTSARKLSEAIKAALGVEPRYTAFPVDGPEEMTLFVGTNPKDN